MLSDCQLVICLSVFVGAVWASPFELAVRGEKMSSVSYEERSWGSNAVCQKGDKSLYTDISCSR